MILAFKVVGDGSGSVYCLYSNGSYDRFPDWDAYLQMCANLGINPDAWVWLYLNEVAEFCPAC